MKPKQIRKKTAGFSDRGFDLGRRAGTPVAYQPGETEDDGGPHYNGYGFADVRRACDRYLRKHCPEYVRNMEAAAALGNLTAANRRARA